MRLARPYPHRPHPADHRRLLPATAFGGAVFLLLADLAARTLVAPIELPIGVVSGIAGGSLFVYLLTRKNANA